MSNQSFDPESGVFWIVTIVALCVVLCAVVGVLVLSGRIAL